VRRSPAPLAFGSWP